MASKIYPYISWLSGDTKGHVMTIDVLLEESPTYSAILTKYPIEKGADITDHSQPENVKLNITGLFVDFPFVEFSGKPNIPNFPDAAPVGAEDRAIGMFRVLDFLRTEGRLITYRSKRLLLDNCLIHNVSYTQDKNSGNGIKFKLTIEQQTFAESKRVKTKRPATAAGQQCLVQGDKTSTTPPAEQTASYLKQRKDGTIQSLPFFR